ncbi:hypothetical protein [Sphingomonas sp. KC8]|uniref:hypothetical protein n=1 Tax=Sphingomonas sp. KC8 TaxID=1030157 RepID=UPI000248A789|nr:hypothetical protein [Sphingomonas sp. KC8]ARS28275.1 hypothetical protein KC8_13410 [Sphingomonas sp. KC8]
MPVARIFHLSVVRDGLMNALRQAGHAFTPARFHSWFAGLTSLSTEAAVAAQPPRALCEAILTDLGHSRSEGLAGSARALQRALLAPRDGEVRAGHDAAAAVMMEAHAIVAELSREPAPLPFALLSTLHQAFGRSPVFAPARWDLVALTGPGGLIPFEQSGAPSPRWAVEAVIGETLRVHGFMRSPLPWPNLIRLDATAPDIADENRRLTIALGLREAVLAQQTRLDHARQAAARIVRFTQGQRTTSRAPRALEWLAGFGPLRSAQLEAILAATRLGVRGMLTALEAEGLIARETIGGVHLVSITHSDGRAEPRQVLPASSGFSAGALEEFDASVAAIDRLLVRPG